MRIFLPVLVFYCMSALALGAISGKTKEIKLKALADQLFDTMLAAKDQSSNKTRISELKTVFDKVKQNPIRFFDLMITIGKNNKALSDEAMKIIDFSQFDQCITMLIDLILQRLDYWMQMKSTTTTTNGMSSTTTTGAMTTGTTTSSTTSNTTPGTVTITVSQSQTTTSTISTTTTTTTITTTTTTTTTTSTTPTTTRNAIIFTTPAIVADTFVIDPLYCANFTRKDCALAPGQSVNLVPFLCKSMCACETVKDCGGQGKPVLNSVGDCKCICNDGYSGPNCQINDREFCFLSLKPSCTDLFILVACPNLCNS